MSNVKSIDKALKVLIRHESEQLPNAKFSAVSSINIAVIPIPPFNKKEHQKGRFNHVSYS